MACHVYPSPKVEKREIGSSTYHCHQIHLLLQPSHPTQFPPAGPHSTLLPLSAHLLLPFWQCSTWHATRVPFIAVTDLNSQCQPIMSSASSWTPSYWVPHLHLNCLLFPTILDRVKIWNKNIFTKEIMDKLNWTVPGTSKKSINHGFHYTGRNSVWSYADTYNRVH